MTARPDAYASLIEPATVKIERLLPGPVERVWDYLTKGELRRQWLAAGEMELKMGAPFELIWRNDELTDPPGKRPDGFSDEHRMESRITELDEPHKLAFSWAQGEVSFTLEPKGGEVLLIVIHHRISDRENLLRIGAGWHAHLDVLAGRLANEPAPPFWDHWTRLHGEYGHRIPE